jgi:hypothetical protein
MFSRWSVHLRRRNALSRTQLAEAFCAAYQPQDGARLQAFTIDAVAPIKTWLAARTNEYERHSQCHAFRRGLEGGKAVLWHKRWPTDEIWLGMDAKHTPHQLFKDGRAPTPDDYAREVGESLRKAPPGGSTYIKALIAGLFKLHTHGCLKNCLKEYEECVAAVNAMDEDQWLSIPFHWPEGGEFACERERRAPDGAASDDSARRLRQMGCSQPVMTTHRRKPKYMIDGEEVRVGERFNTSDLGYATPKI